MDTLQKHNICTNVPSSHTSRSYLQFGLFGFEGLIVAIVKNAFLFVIKFNLPPDSNGFLLILLFDHVDGGDKFLRNVGPRGP
jgi:hypothetical protein